MGNQMFQIAACIAHARNMGVKWIIPTTTIDQKVWPAYFPTIEGASEKMFHYPIYKERSFEYRKIPAVDGMKLDGYFQSEKYFADHIDYLRGVFFPFHSFETKQNKIAIHVRRGDYLHFADIHPPLSMNYYKKAIELFPDREFLVFSDDIEWCKQNFTGDRFSFSEGKSAQEDMISMASCEHQIVANSTFSWWAAYLNQNPDKYIVSPSVQDWFAGANKRHNTTDLIPSTWTQLRAF